MSMPSILMVTSSDRLLRHAPSRDHSRDASPPSPRPSPSPRERESLRFPLPRRGGEGRVRGLAMTEFALAIRNFVGPGEVPDVQRIYASAERAEALGFESLWAWDHVLLGVEPAFPILDSITLLGAVA